MNISGVLAFVPSILSNGLIPVVAFLDELGSNCRPTAGSRENHVPQWEKDDYRAMRMRLQFPGKVEAWIKNAEQAARPG